jgi:hypothetical protein
MEENQIKQSRLKLSEIKIEQRLLESELDKIDGLIMSKFDQTTLTLTVNYRPNVVSLRKLIEKTKAIGACEVSYLPDEKGKGDIRVILAEEVRGYRNKFFISLSLLVPILVLMWIIPFTNPSFLISFELRKGINAYILILCGLSTAI